MIRYSFGVLCVCALGLMPLVGCSETAGGTSSEQDNWAPLDYESNPHSAKYDFSAVDSAVADFVAGWSTVDGLTLAVVRKDEGQIYEKGYGDFGRDRISAIASTSKVLSVGVILTLVDAGLLDLDRPVAEYLGWGDYHPTVTMRQLLSMMSGITRVPEVDDKLDACTWDPATDLQECAREIFQDESESIPPGEEFRYSGPAWQLAGGVAEVVSGRTWAKLVEEKLVAPCGLPNTGYTNWGYRADYPDSFDPDDIPASENPHLGGGAHSTVNDYSKVLLMHLHGGICGHATPERVLSSDMVQRMQEALVPEGVAFPPSWAPVAVNYGMGWWWYEEDPPLFIDPGAWGAWAVLHPEEGWGAILILEARGLAGLAYEMVPLIREAVLEADRAL